MNTLANQEVQGIVKQSGVILTDLELTEIELAGFGLNDFSKEGLALVVYENNDRYCAKELIMLPSQTCPEHRHPDIVLESKEKVTGKMETFRCRWGVVYLYVEGQGSADSIKATVPAGSEDYYTVFNEVVLTPGQQYTIPPNTLHWFQAGPKGAIVSEFSSASRDECDIFTDPRIVRVEED
ncbi:D-lyxose/D-mannose family sugar isomerase [Planctomycetota bacterium]|nr:D-lyxose/D-mannose family sugar isomerase [Planctomycetota bacterium]